MTSQSTVAIGLGALSILFYVYRNWMFPVVGYAGAAVLGAIVGFSAVAFGGRKHAFSSSHMDKPTNNVLHELLVINGRTDGATVTADNRRQTVVFTKNIDAAVDNVLELTIRDYVVSWLGPLVHDHAPITNSIKEDIWSALTNLRDRLNKMDEVKFMTNDVTLKLCQHFRKIRSASCGSTRDRRSTFSLRPYLTSEESETEFLRKVAELLVILLAPRSYSQSVPVRHLLRELLVSSVLYPTVSMLCDPDYINQKLLDYLQYHERLMEEHKKTYTYAATYEGFVKLIHECGNVEQLKHVRYNIMTEIMQATTINNLKKSKGIDVEKEFISQGTAKGDLLQARNLKRYINQLTFAKALCEKRLKMLGGPEYVTTDSCGRASGAAASDTIAGEEVALDNPKVLPYSTIMESDFARSFFMKFLANEDAQHLLEFYVAVEEMKECEKAKIHQVASMAFKTYIGQVSGTLKLDRSVLKGMEAFMIGNKGPESFVETQEEVLRFLEDRYYPSFVVSSTYQKMMAEADRIGIEFIKLPSEGDGIDCGDGSGSTTAAAAVAHSGVGGNVLGIPLSDHSSFAKDKLDRLDERLSNKLQALNAIKNSLLSDGAKVVAMLDKEIEAMKTERGFLCSHIERTEMWAEKLGSWRVLVHSIEMVEERDRMVPLFLLVVHPNGDDADADAEVKDSDDDNDNDDEDDDRMQGWVVKRRIADFNDLAHRLSQIGPWVRNIELPKENRIRNRSTDRLIFDKTIAMLQRFIDAVLNDETLCSCEAVYAFLSPSPEHLKRCPPPCSPKKSKFSLSTFFKSTRGSGSQGGGGSDDDDDDLLFFDDMDGSSKDDRIAEPLYALVEEIFETKGVFMLLRRTLISFVQITFGRTINRQLRDTVSWMFGEPMVVYYVHLFRDSVWPGGVIYSPISARSDEQKLETRCQAKRQLLDCIPDMLSNLVGQQNAKKGVRKVFESLQDVRLNKQIFYELLEMLIVELFPEIKV